MSYCRFTEESDFYMYDDETGVMIWVSGRGRRLGIEDSHFDTLKEARDFLAAGVAQGGKLPPHVLKSIDDELEAERIQPEGAD